MSGSECARTDSDLIARAIAGPDSEAFASLVRKYQSPVRGWLRRLAKNEALADDLAQETFIRAWQRLHQYSGRGRFLSWLMKLAYNEFLQAKRGAGRYRAQVERFAADREVLAQNSAGLAEESADLDRYLALLSADERNVMILIYAYGLSHSEACEVSGLPLGTVKSHVRRGREKIRTRFGLQEVANG